MSLSTRIAPHLTYLRRYSRAITGSQTSGDAYVRALLEMLIADISIFPQSSSDRIAVFNKGGIEQVSAPRELYEHPANEFVADFVGISTAVDRDGERFTIRPEKIRIIEDGESTDGMHTETGHIVEVAYVGMVTRLHVRLDSGGTIQLARQNLDSESSSQNEAINAQVTVGWRSDHIVPIQPQTGNKNEVLEEKRS